MIRVVETVATSLITGFLAASLGSYVTQIKHEVQMKHISETLSEIKNELKRVNALDTRIAVLEYEIEKR